MSKKQTSTRAWLSAAVAVLCALLLAPAAQASFGFLPGAEGFDFNAANEDGSAVTQAGSHPYQVITDLHFKSTTDQGEVIPDGDIKDAHVDLPPGLVGNPTNFTQCTIAEFNTPEPNPAIPGTNKAKGFLSFDSCPSSSQVGIVKVGLFFPGAEGVLPLYNLVHPPGKPAQFGFNPLGLGIRLTPHIRLGDDGLTIDSIKTPQAVRLFGVKVIFWGNPYDPSHNGQRGYCLGILGEPYGGPLMEPGATCAVDAPARALLTMPTSCSGPKTISAQINSWQTPELFDQRSILSHDPEGNPIGLDGCNRLAFSPQAQAHPSTDRASAPTGLAFDLDVNDEGLSNPSGIAQSEIKKTVVTLPQGMSVNPSAGEGLGVCSPADFARETLETTAGEGCPNDSKVGTVRIESPLIEEPVNGSLYIAKQNDNPFNSLLALYIVARNQANGVFVKTAGEVKPDPKTGQLTTTFDNLPQLPFDHFELSFREGQRSPLISPPACGTYEVESELYPYADPNTPLHETSAFTTTKGYDGGACPTGGLPPFHPELNAGTLNNAAGRFSPFNVRISRNDGEQEITHFSIKLPPGVIGKLAGVPFCSEGAIEAAKAKTGTQEEEAPSCPKASEVGRTLVGAGVGSVLAYAPGRLYLAGPYHGSALSIAAITAAKVGPFDLGTVVVRQALRIDPETAEVFIDATGSDPIPHIIDGIPVHLRDIRAYVDRPEFVLNPTDCTPTSTASTVLGSGLDFVSEADDNPITVTSPFQAADCAALPFKPRLALKLLGGSKRGAHPAFRAKLKMNGIGEAAIARAQVTLPHSEFLENSHIKTICTRVQFNQGAIPGANCPAGSVYGYAKATTPLLDEALAGPVFLRSSEHQLPDLVVALHSAKINVDVVGRIDSVKGGGIRNTFEALPDAPVSEFTLTLLGAKKGLLVNSTNLCKGTHRAEVNFDAQNGKVSDTKPALKAQCAKSHKTKRSARHKRAHRVS